MRPMQHALTFPPLSPAGMDANPSFKVVIAYEDFDTGKLAKRTYDFLTEALGPDCSFTNQMWKFDVLLLPKLREIAIEDASGADIIIISSRGRELPTHVTQWIDGWKATAHNPLALVALFDPHQEARGEVNAARSYLAEVARNRNMEFFAQTDVSGSRPGSESSFAGNSDRKS